MLVFVALQGLDEHLLLVVGELLAQLQVAADDLVLEALDFVGFLVEVVLELVVVFLGGAVVLDGGVALGGESAGQLGLLVDGVVGVVEFSAELSDLVALVAGGSAEEVKVGGDVVFHLGDVFLGEGGGEVAVEVVEFLDELELDFAGGFMCHVFVC